MREVRVASAAAMELLVATARLTLTGSDAARALAAARGVRDWEALLALARRHRVVPFVTRHLAAHAAGVWGEAALAAFAGAEREVATHALAHARELARVSGAFRSAGVRALPYKGPALALAAYGDVGVRDGVDLDFVVRPADVGRARAVLRTLGYRPREGMSPAQEGAIYGGQGHYPYVGGTDGDARMVELHWRFAATRFPWNPLLEEILARASGVTLAGERIALPAREDLLLLLLMHGARHVWEELEWVAAVSELLRAGAVDDDLLLARARAVGGRRAVLAGLEVARRTLDAPVSDRLVAQAALDPEVEPLVREALACLFDGPSASPLQRNNARAYHLLCLERRRDRLRFMVQSALRPTPREWELVRLPGALTFLYVPIRIGKLLLRR